MTQILLGLFAILPLWLFHAFGIALGWLAYWLSPSYAVKIRSHILASGLAQDAAGIRRLVRAAVGETGKAALELPIAWGRSPEKVVRLVKSCEGWAHVDAALTAGKGILFVTPHLGAYDIAGRYLSAALPFPLTAMYRPPKQKWLEPLMNAGRARGQGKTAPATPQGVRQLFKTLRQGEAVLMLPDQVPGEGNGVWANFFGRPAYTMTLLSRIAESTGAAVLLFYGRRLSWGRGYVVHIEPLVGAFGGDQQKDAELLNQNLERLIRQCPEQYLWSYNRYKRPAGAPAPTA